MSINVARHREWLDRRNDPLERKQIAYTALDAYEALENKDHIQLDDLQPIVTAAKSKYSTVWDIGTVFLVRLAESHAAAREAMLKIMESPKANERSQIVWALTARLPKDFRVQMIRKAITDRSKYVRFEAATKADLFGFKELIPEIEAQRDRESDPESKSALDFHVVMLRDGYLLKRSADGSFYLAVRTKNGWGGSYITQEDIDDGRLWEKIEKMKNLY